MRTVRGRRPALVSLLAVLVFVLSSVLGLLGVGAAPADGPQAAPVAQTADEDVLYVALIWHQHQPVYAIDAETGAYIRPWVRAHAAKDYLDMATILEDYPDMHVTFNYTPSLIRQLDDISAGTKDLYWVLAEVPAEELTDDQKRFILERFFDTNPTVIARFPRYQELADARAAIGNDAALASWTAQDFRDLQVLFNLAWTDPDWLAEEPLAALVAQERDYTEVDKPVIFAEHLRIVQEVLPYHAELQRAGQIEITMTPYTHPILPLIVDSDLAAVAMPEAELPPRFVYGQDAVAQVELGVQLYEDHFGVAPRGMWPAEGSVAQPMVQMVANAGIQWMATDEDVLARSLPDVEDFTRDSADTVQQAEALYQMYSVTGGRGGDVAIIFRDHLISDKLGFEYSGMSGTAAAADLMQRLDNIQAELAAEGAEGPNLVTILLDGENAWEYYPNDGKAFLNAMYAGLADAPNIRTVTPSEYLALTDDLQPIEDLWPGSWITPDYSTWIGEPEENLAWEYLLRTREALEAALPRLSESARADAFEAMYFAEGSDWFWYFGADQDSGQDEAFDAMFRTHLRNVFEAISTTPPDWLDVPVIPLTPQVPDQPFEAPATITVDGTAADGEWQGTAFYDLSAAEGVLSGLAYSIDGEALSLRVDAADGFSDDLTLAFYFSADDDAAPLKARPRAGDELLGFGARRMVEVTFADGAATATAYTSDSAADWVPYADDAGLTASARADVLEVALPLEPLLGALQPGNTFNMRLVARTAEAALLAPPTGPALVTLPDAGVPNIVLAVQDPQGDDHGPGSYTYPTDVVFARGAYDITDFIVGYDDESVIFRLAFRGAVENEWGAPNGMGIHTIDIYVDQDGPANGARLLLPGRNAALPADYGWDLAIWAEGWEPGMYRPSPNGPVQVDGNLSILTNAGQRRITIRVPRSVLEGDPADWSYAAVVASQEGYPSAGVWRIRDVQTSAEQWLVGGASGGTTNHTRLMDVAYPEEGVQEAMLSDFPPSDADVDDLTPDDFGQVPVNGVSAEE